MSGERDREKMQALCCALFSLCSLMRECRRGRLDVLTIYPPNGDCTKIQSQRGQRKLRGYAIAPSWATKQHTATTQQPEPKRTDSTTLNAANISSQFFVPFHSDFRNRRKACTHTTGMHNCSIVRQRGAHHFICATSLLRFASANMLTESRRRLDDTMRQGCGELCSCVWRALLSIRRFLPSRSCGVKLLITLPTSQRWSKRSHRFAAKTYTAALSPDG